jgi:hypothetical protein
VWPLRSEETSRLGSMDPVVKRDQVRAAWWQEKKDEVMYSFLVEPQNQGRAGMTWWPSHKWDWHGPWRLHRVREVCGGSPQNRRGYLVDPQNQDRRLGGRRRDPGAPINFKAGDTQHDRGACVGRMRRPDGCAVVRWRTSCVDVDVKSAPHAKHTASWIS